MKIYVPYGINRLVEAMGPCGAYKTYEEAEAAAKEWLDEWKIQEYEVEV